ncbi:MAG: hypothetical protein HQ446_08170 [Polaromonas sp.]|nr:hypothetical protein [Polaromonas sp.]
MSTGDFPTKYAISDIGRRCAELVSDAVFDKSNELDDLLDYCMGIPSRRDMH